jgi:2'-5' RNA ligase
MRLFIAINFDRKTNQKLLDIQSVLKSKSTNANFSRAENLHLTLVFLGEIPEKRLPQIKQAMASVSNTPVTLEFINVGSFSGGIYYVGINRTPELAALQSELSERLREEGFKLEDRSYSPHVTLARKLQSDNKIKVDFKAFCMTADKISLMKSENIGGRLVYTEIFTSSLA